MKYIDKIKSPADLKKLPVAELDELAAEIRTLLIKKLSEHGGHCGPNLGMVEATIAMHYVSKARWANQLSFAAPCQCVTPAGMWITVPGRISCGGMPSC